MELQKIESRKGFYIGDICYSLKDEYYDEIWGRKNQFEDGIFNVELENGKNYDFAVYGTKYGDGSYPDSNYNYEFFVDAGVLGVVPYELVDFEKIEKKNSGVLFVDGPGYATLEYKDGYFDFTIYNLSNEIVKDIEVDTDDYVEEYYDEY